MKKALKLYSSPNGDRWYLIRDASGEVFIHHEAETAPLERTDSLPVLLAAG